MPSAVLVSAVALGVPFYTSVTWTFTVMVGMVLAISCLGLLALVGWAREISLAQAGLTGSALYATFLLEWDYDTGRRMPFLLAAALAVLFAVAVSIVTALVAVRLAAPYVIVLTLSVQFLLEQTIFRKVGCLCEPTIDRPSLFGLSLRQDERFYYLLLTVLGLCVLGLVRLRRSRFGRAMIMAGVDPEAAAASGVSPWRYRVAAFGVAGLFAGIAGAVSTPLYFSPPGDLQYISVNSLVYLAVPVLAGFDSIGGVVVAAVGLALLPQVWLEAQLNVFLLAGPAMAVGALLGPRGLGGLLPRRRRRPTPVLVVPHAS